MGLLSDLLRPPRGVELLGFGDDFFDNVLTPATEQMNGFIGAVQMPEMSGSDGIGFPKATDQMSFDSPMPLSGGAVTSPGIPDMGWTIPGMPSGFGDIGNSWFGGIFSSGVGQAGVNSPGSAIGDPFSTLSGLIQKQRRDAASPTTTSTGVLTMAGASEWGDGLVPYQFGDAELTSAEAYAACGPAAYVAFSRLTGRNPTLREAVDLAAQYGWNTGGGMNGMGNTVRMFQAQGVPIEADYSANPNTIVAKLQQGIPVILSTGRHYYVADRIDENGRLHVGASGRAIRGGKDWMTFGEIEAQFGGDPIDGAIYFSGQVQQGSSGTGGTGEQRRNVILKMAQEHDGVEFAMVINGILNLEAGLDGAVGDNGNSFGPFQFYTGGKLPGYAAALGVSIEEAKRLTMDPQLVARYAFTYLHPKYVEGKKLGLSGPDLLYYVQTKGQVSVAPSAERLNAAWGDSVNRFYGG